MVCEEEQTTQMVQQLISAMTRMRADRHEFSLYPTIELKSSGKTRKDSQVKC